MQFSFFLAALFSLLATRVMAEFNITLPAPVGVILATDFFNTTDPARTVCNQNCTIATAAIQACGTNSTCLCNSLTLAPINDCEQCMFNSLVADFRLPEDPRAGQLTSLQAYGASCVGVPDANLTKAQLTLQNAPNWDGPFGQGLTPVTTGITLVVTLFLGIGLISVVCTM